VEEVEDFATQWIYWYNNQRPNLTLGYITLKWQLAMVV
jgi:hypothetical protein